MSNNNIEKDEDLFIGETIFNKYKLIRKLGQGSFGSIYEAQSKYSNKFYAVKLEDMKQDQFILEDESIFLSYLNIPQIPKVKTFGYSGSYIILVMELLGKSLDKIINELPSRKLSIRCVCNIAYQLILIFEKIHNCWIIHRDIKPANIAIGREEKSKYIYLFDFGLSKKFISSKTLKHYPFRQNNKLIGNARYSSINALNGGTQSRRDDLESLGYLTIYLLVGRLPWQGYISRSKEDKYYKIKQIKQQTTAEQLCEGLPRQFQEYIKYTRSLKYEENPNYNYLKNLFLSVLKSYNYDFDYYYDWDQVGLTNSEIRNNEKNNDNQISNIINNQHIVSNIYPKISNLVDERKKVGGSFDGDKFVYDVEEESNINIEKLKSGNQINETEADFYNYSNSMTPYPRKKKTDKQSGCIPCQPKGYKDIDNNCCIIF